MATTDLFQTERADHGERIMLQTRASLAAPSGAVRAMLDGSDTASLLALAKERASDPSIFDEFAPDFWLAEISNNAVDFYGTRMHESSLANYVANLKAGVSFLHSHNTREYIGQSLTGWEVVDGSVHGDNVPVRRVIGAFMTIPGQRFGSMDTDSFIAGRKSGVLRDVSIGFWSDDVRCSICGGQMYMGWFGVCGIECEHIPGMNYPVLDESGNPLSALDGTPRMRTCFAWVWDGNIGEVSAVYDGATPNAGFLKASLMADAGKLSDGERARFEMATRQKLPTFGHGAAQGVAITRTANGGVRIAPAEESGQEETEMPEETREATVPANTAEVTVTLDDMVETVRDLAERSGMTFKPEATSLDILAELTGEVTSLRAKVTELEPDAVVGREYRTSLIEDAIAAGVRAKGADKFRETTYRSMLAGASIESIKDVRDEWIADGDARLAGSGDGPGGRRTKDSAGDGAPAAESGEQRQASVPDRLFKG